MIATYRSVRLAIIFQLRVTGHGRRDGYDRSAPKPEVDDAINSGTPSHLDVGLDQNAMVVRRQQFLQSLQRSYTAGGILFTVAAT